MNDSIDSILTPLCEGLQWQPDTAQLAINPTDTAIAGPMPVADIATAAFSALGLALESLHRARGGPHQRVQVSRRHASLAMRSADFLEIDGAAPVSWDPLTGYYKTGDNRWVYLHTNFRHHRDGTLTLLGCDATRESASAALLDWRAEDFESHAADRGLCVGMLRERADWWQHPQRAALDERPVIDLQHHHSAPGGTLAVGAQPLSGVRVLDLSRVLAGPMAGRALAEHGATVMRVGADHLPTFESLAIDTGYSKLSTHLDLRQAADRAAFDQLVSDADILIDGYRPGALEVFGYSANTLQARHPKLIHIGLSAYGNRGPWAGRRGFDSLVQSPTGLARAPEDGSNPVRLPCQPLDYLTGCLAALAAVRALSLRETGQGVYCADLALARTANWIHTAHDAIGDEPAPIAANAARDTLLDCLTETESPFGRLSSLSPPMTLERTPWRWRAPQPLGSHTPSWPTP